MVRSLLPGWSASQTPCPCHRPRVLDPSEAASAADGVGGAWVAAADDAVDANAGAVARAEIRVDSLPWAPADAAATRSLRSAADWRSRAAVVVVPLLPSCLAAAAAHWVARRSCNTAVH